MTCSQHWGQLKSGASGLQTHSPWSIEESRLFGFATSLIWALGESFRRIMLRARPLRRRERVFEGVRGICLDRELGKGRESFTMLLGHYGGAAQIPTLVQLLDDPEVSGHAVYALRLLSASAAADKVRPFLDSPKAWVRKEARKYFQKIESAVKR
jgi:hypothetical protein